jgi:hypothetical protein
MNTRKNRRTQKRINKRKSRYGYMGGQVLPDLERVNKMSQIDIDTYKEMTDENSKKTFLDSKVNLDGSLIVIPPSNSNTPPLPPSNSNTPPPSSNSNSNTPPLSSSNSTPPPSNKTTMEGGRYRRKSRRNKSRSRRHQSRRHQSKHHYSKRR